MKVTGNKFCKKSKTGSHQWSISLNHNFYPDQGGIEQAFISSTIEMREDVSCGYCGVPAEALMIFENNSLRIGTIKIKQKEKFRGIK